MILLRCKVSGAASGRLKLPSGNGAARYQSGQNIGIMKLARMPIERLSGMPIFK